MVALKPITMEALRLDDVKVLLSGILKGILEVEMGRPRNRGQATIARPKLLTSFGSLRNPLALSEVTQTISWTCHGLKVRYSLKNNLLVCN